MKKLLLTCSTILFFISLSGCKDNTTKNSETFLPDDEYYYGRDEYRLWTKKRYNA